MITIRRDAFDDARHRRGLTIRGLARRIGVSHVAVVCWRSGRTRPTMAHAIALCDALGVTVDDLWGRR